MGHSTVMLRRRWLLAAAMVVAGAALASLLLPPRGYAAACFGNVLQSLLLAFLVLLLLWCARSAAGRVRWFWSAMAVGAGTWLAATLLWTWFEVVVRRPVPEPFLGDVIFFVHLVPFMGALALRPHRTHGNHRLDFGLLDFVLLLLWWLYLYCFIVIPWQYVVPERERYAFSFHLLYAIENVALLLHFVLVFRRSRGSWRITYGAFVAAAAVYAVASQVLNHAISGDAYYTGSAYDLPLVVSMLMFIGAALIGYTRAPEPTEEGGSRMAGVLASRLAMIAVLSLPFMGAWALTADTPRRVAQYRVALTAVALLVLTFLVFLKQHLLDRELVHSWEESQQRFHHLRRFQAQLVQTEKLSALAQLVSGAAHEINNPLTAIMGYADLLEHDSVLAPEKRAYVEKISSQARRVREVVANLRSFAKQIPGEKTALDLTPLLVDVISLCASDLDGDSIRIESELAPELPSVYADSNQLLQVCFHIISNGIDALRHVGGGVLRVASRVDRNNVVVEFTDNGPGVPDTQKVFDPFFTTKAVGKGAGLGLSACYGIIQDHKGQIFCANHATGGATFTVMLPIIEPGKKPAATASNTPVLAASQ